MKIFRPSPWAPWILCLAFCVVASGRLGADVIISEVLASNRDDYVDSDGDSPDWVELHNDGGEGLKLDVQSLRGILSDRYVLSDYHRHHVTDEANFALRQDGSCRRSLLAVRREAAGHTAEAVGGDVIAG